MPRGNVAARDRPPQIFRRMQIYSWIFACVALSVPPGVHNGEQESNNFHLLSKSFILVLILFFNWKKCTFYILYITFYERSIYYAYSIFYLLFCFVLFFFLLGEKNYLSIFLSFTFGFCLTKTGTLEQWRIVNARWTVMLQCCELLKVCITMLYLQ